MELRTALLALLLLPPAAFPANAETLTRTLLHVAVAPMPAPMLATGFHPDIDIASYLVSEKLDGVRARWDGRQLLTRAGNRIDAPAWFTAGWPAQAIEGELWIGRGQFQQVSDLVRALQPDTSAWRQVHFMAFDLPTSPQPFATRTRALRDLVRRAALPQLQRIAQVHLTDRAQLDARLDAVVAGRGEGLMLHYAFAHYRPGRTDELLKYKRWDDAEARVVGYRPGKGKYAGMVGALLVEDAHGRRFALGSGLRDADRTRPPPIGSMVTFRYNGLTAKGTPRFARYQRMHADAASVATR
ncbi:DNA ligase [Thermomonas sp.]|uniref:DNA ligase n=1 Tax=Thermomonas sp. TaxID=1971895 RepID=UPI0024878FC1|nr:DNA ligase [Thermomonas sp.]MDI1252671.1 DNA ligase [Thermomonas sp.]